MPNVEGVSCFIKSSRDTKLPRPGKYLEDHNKEPFANREILSPSPGSGGSPHALLLVGGLAESPGAR